MFLNSSTIASLRFFEAAARCLSFKRAAAELHVTQGAVSQHIKQLEVALGRPLFDRLTRQIRLTEDGKRLAAVVERSLKEIEETAQAIAAPSASVAIRLRAGPSFALRWLFPRLGDFYEQHPTIKLSLIAAHGYFDPAQRDFDLAIESTRGKLPGLQVEGLMDEYLLPVCSPEYLAQHPLKRPSDLERCTFLHDGQAWIGGAANAEWRYWLDAVGASAVNCDEGQVFSLAYMSTEAAVGHQGVAMGRRVLVADLIAEGRLVAPFKQQVKSPVRYCLAYPKELAQQPGLRAVIQWLKEQVRAVEAS